MSAPDPELCPRCGKVLTLPHRCFGRMPKGRGSNRVRAERDIADRLALGFMLLDYEEQWDQYCNVADEWPETVLKKRIRQRGKFPEHQYRNKEDI